MGKPSAPRPPDPVQTARAQTESNAATARLEAQLNRVSQNTPYGNVTYSNNGDNWTQTVTESPNQRQLREGQEGLGIGLNDLATQQVGRVGGILNDPYESRRLDLAAALGGPLDVGRADLSRYDPTTQLNGVGDDVRARMGELARTGLDDTFNRSEEALRTRLANQGVNAGTAAFDAEMEAFNRGKGNAYADAERQAFAAALGARQQAAGELGQGATTALGEFDANTGAALAERTGRLDETLRQYGADQNADLADRQVPLNEIISIMSGTPLTPINPGQAAQTGVANTDIAGIYQNNYANQMAAYQQQMASRNAMLGGLFRLGGAALGAI